MKNKDIILKGDIFDSTYHIPYEGFIVINGNKIVVVEKGLNNLNAWINKGAEYIDCSGKLIMPGFIDAHMHFFDGAFQNSKFMCRDLFGCKSAHECVDAIAKFGEKNPDYERLTGMGWFIPQWEDGEKPHKALLDAVDKQRPVYLMCADGHSFWLNSKALEECNIRADMNLLFGSIELDNNGEPNGIIHELDVCAPCATKSQKLPPSDSKFLLASFIDELVKNGITSTTNMAISPNPEPLTDEMLIIKNLENDNELKMRLNLYPSLGTTTDFTIASEMKRAFSSDMYRVAGLKAFVDGVHGNNTALLLEPYADQPNHLGAAFFPFELYKQQVVAANREGFGVKLHCVGEGATRLALNVFQDSSEANKNTDYRNSIEHIETITLEDVQRLANLKVTASVQPSHLMYGEDTIREKLGDERAKMEYALKTMLDAGVNIAFGTDYPVATFNPMLNIYFSTTRCSVNGQPIGREPDQTITLADALKAYTIGGAVNLKMEDKLGTLEPGKLADIIVFDCNLFNIESRELLNAQIDLTIVDGKKVFQKDINS